MACAVGLDVRDCHGVVVRSTASPGRLEPVPAYGAANRPGGEQIMPDQERLSYAPAGPGAVPALLVVRDPLARRPHDGRRRQRIRRRSVVLPGQAGMHQRWTARAATAGRPSAERRRGMPDSWGSISLSRAWPGDAGRAAAGLPWDRGLLQAGEHAVQGGDAVSGSADVQHELRRAGLLPSRLPRGSTASPRRPGSAVPPRYPVPGGSRGEGRRRSFACPVIARAASRAQQAGLGRQARHGERAGHRHARGWIGGYLRCGHGLPPRCAA